MPPTASSSAAASPRSTPRSSPRRRSASWPSCTGTPAAAHCARLRTRGPPWLSRRAPPLPFAARRRSNFNGRRLELLHRREFRQAAIDAGQLPDFLPETAHIRAGNWRGPPPAPGLVDRRVEITGPVDRKMVINALNSGASTFMADFEDSNAPTWDNNVSGQINLRDANRRTINFSAGGKQYQLNSKVATLIVRYGAGPPRPGGGEDGAAPTCPG